MKKLKNLTTDHIKDRIYPNDSQGKFEKSNNLLLENFMANGSCVEPMDFDNDGDIDLFVGTRSVVNNYGYQPRNYILKNDGNGKFSDITVQVAPQTPTLW